MDDDFFFLIGKIYFPFSLIFALFDKHEVPNMHNVMEKHFKIYIYIVSIFLSLPIFSRSYAFVACL